MKLQNIFTKCLYITLFLSIITNTIRQNPAPATTQPQTPPSTNSTVANATQSNVTLQGTQLAAYPNPSEAPTHKDQLGKNNAFTLKISGALKEIFPKDTLTMHEFIQNMKFVLPQLTQGEIEQIFYFVDINKNDKIALGE